METTRHVSDLASLARTFTARAQPVTPGRGQTGADDVEPQEVEVRILTKVHTAVRARAANQDQVVADVARAVLFQAAAKVKPAQIKAYEDRRSALVKEAGDRAARLAWSRARKKLSEQGLTGAELDAAVDADPSVGQARAAAMERASNSRLPLREYLGTGARHRLRFIAPAKAYRDAATAILASGRTVVSVVEEGLREYARTGRL
jgi:hypothetical protein